MRRLFRTTASLMLPLIMIACTAIPSSIHEPTSANRLSNSISTFPPMRMFSGPKVSQPQRSNRAIALDFMELSFQLESGRALPVFTRFEGPVTVRTRGKTPSSLNLDLDQLITRLRNEAGIDIRRSTRDGPASITIESIPRSELQRAVPQAACFVVPRVTSWSEFKRHRRSSITDWTTLTVRETMSVFIPSDVAPQEVRDCLHEELAQALGPLNDLYHLKDSVFNDDNFHTVLTGFDMLILRATYTGELRSGMTPKQVAQLLPGILARLNPRGKNGVDERRSPTTREWINQIEIALGPQTAIARRRAAASQAVTLARAGNWNDNRLAFALFALGRLSLGQDPELALNAFLQAGSIYGSDPSMAIHDAHIAMQLAGYALSGGQASIAIDIVNAHESAVRAAENAALLATLLLVKAEALDLLGNSDAAARLRLEALGWARYGFGEDENVRRHATEITNLNPRRRQGAT